MPGAIPNPLRIYRITHRNNLRHILLNGICNKGHINADPNFHAIGNSQIIGARTQHPVKILNYGNIGDYVPFYFYPKSVMLYNILTGYTVQKVSPEEIIFLISSVNSITQNNLRYFFTDGQANTHISRHYNQLTDLDKIDWDVVTSSDFRKTIVDNDRPRRYQAEFLVHNHVPLNCIDGIVVYNQVSSNFVRTILNDTGIIIPIYINNNFYFNR